MSVFITGDSHCGMLARVADDAAGPGQVVVRVLGSGLLLRQVFFVDEGTHVRILEPSIRKRVPRLPAQDADGRFRAYGICGPLNTVELWRNASWSSFAPVGLARGETPVSRALLERAIRKRTGVWQELIGILRRIGTPVFVIEAPRPFPLHRAFEAVRKDVVQHVDGEYRRLVREWLAELAVPVVDVPAQCLDEDGFMREQFRSERAGDTMHGNLDFGRLMMQQTMQLARQSGWLTG